ncbi:MAG: SpoVG family protein [Planctomycetes bacterium]|nr:SpoVG family protein [Planctomycetota bacterium]
MNITEVRVKLVHPGHDKLRAFCSITIDDDFVVRDLKIIEGAKGAFVAMPSRKLMSRCPGCGGKNHQRASYCNECGMRLDRERPPAGSDGRTKLHADIAHPINSRCREIIQRRVLESYHDELDRSQQPGYQPPDMDDYDYDDLGVAASDFTGDGGDDSLRAVSPGGEHPAGQAAALLGAAGADEGRGETMAPMAGRSPGVPEGAGAAASLDASGRGGMAEEPDEEGSRLFGGHRVREVRLRSRLVRDPGDRSRALDDVRFPREVAGSPRRADPRAHDPMQRVMPHRGDSMAPRPGADDPLHRKPRSRVEEVDTEPEDNFGAGLFS